ncbi:MAG TPA: cell division protein FtsA [Candidatus Paceibacterota bacterium]|nr:cell division protein FtsA [Candidatus Paceibacterota bacterium]
MGIFSGNSDRGKLVLVFYIGSSSIEGALFWAQKSGIPKIVFSVSEKITLEENIQADRFLALTIKSLSVVVEKVYSAGLGVPKAIFCVLSSLWYVSQTRIIRLEKNTPFLFTSKLADSLIQKEKNLFQEEHLVKYLRSGTPARLIELKNIKTMMNGYETPNPLNQKGTDLEMTIFIAMCDEQTLGKIEKAIGAHFQSAEIKFSSFAFSSFAVVRDIYAASEDFLLINIDGEMTDITMVKKNILRESISFPLGLNFMIRGVAAALRLSFAEAKSLISLFKDEHAAESETKNLGSAIDKLKKEWLLKFQKSLSTISNDISVPATIYLAVDKEMLNFFSETIKTEQFNQYTLTESKFKVVFLDAKVFHGLAQFEENVVRDIFLIIDSIYIDRFLINPASILSNI